MQVWTGRMPGIFFPKCWRLFILTSQTILKMLQSLFYSHLQRGKSGNLIQHVFQLVVNVLKNLKN